MRDDYFVMFNRGEEQYQVSCPLGSATLGWPGEYALLKGVCVYPGRRTAGTNENSISGSERHLAMQKVVYMGNKKQRVKAMESLFGCIPADITEDEAREERLMSSAKINEYRAEAAQIKKLVDLGKCQVFDDIDALFRVLNSSEQENQMKSEKEDGVN